MALIWTLPALLLGYLTAGVAATILLSVIAIAVASLPDWDQRIAIVSHRGFSHTIWFAGLITTITTAGTLTFWPQIASLLFQHEPYPETVQSLATIQPQIAAGLVGSTVLLSLLSHIFADSLTVGSGKYGIQPVWPLSRRELRFGYCRADSTVWNYGLFFAGGLVYGLFLWILVN